MEIKTIEKSSPHPSPYSLIFQSKEKEDDIKILYHYFFHRLHFNTLGDKEAAFELQSLKLRLTKKYDKNPEHIYYELYCLINDEKYKVTNHTLKQAIIDLCKADKVNYPGLFDCDECVGKEPNLENTSNPNCVTPASYYARLANKSIKKLSEDNYQQAKFFYSLCKPILDKLDRLKTMNNLERNQLNLCIQFIKKIEKISPLDFYSLQTNASKAVLLSYEEWYIKNAFSPIEYKILIDQDKILINAKYFYLMFSLYAYIIKLYHESRIEEKKAPLGFLLKSELTKACSAILEEDWNITMHATTGKEIDSLEVLHQAFLNPEIFHKKMNAIFEKKIKPYKKETELTQKMIEADKLAKENEIKKPYPDLIFAFENQPNAKIIVLNYVIHRLKLSILNAKKAGKELETCEKRLSTANLIPDIYSQLESFANITKSKTLKKAILSLLKTDKLPLNSKKISETWYPLQVGSIEFFTPSPHFNQNYLNFEMEASNLKKEEASIILAIENKARLANNAILNLKNNDYYPEQENIYIRLRDYITHRMALVDTDTFIISQLNTLDFTHLTTSKSKAVVLSYEELYIKNQSGKKNQFIISLDEKEQAINPKYFYLIFSLYAYLILLYYKNRSVEKGQLKASKGPIAHLCFNILDREWAIELHSTIGSQGQSLEALHQAFLDPKNFKEKMTQLFKDIKYCEKSTTLPLPGHVPFFTPSLNLTIPPLHLDPQERQESAEKNQTKISPFKQENFTPNSESKVSGRVCDTPMSIEIFQVIQVPSDLQEKPENKHSPC